MLTAKNLRAKAELVTQVVCHDILNDFEEKLFAQASRGATEFEETYHLNDPKKNINITSWDLGCDIGEKITAELDAAGFKVSYQTMSNSKGLWLSFKVYWGNDADNEWFPYPWEEEEEEDE